MPKVLVFESDSAFASELKAQLEERSCQVTVVDDASAGLQAAAAEKPDLILLAIELPRMNGFSVCNKLKRDANLKAVPLIIMSTDSTEETFEQHRRLRTRAEDYVHKPIAFAELEKRITPLVSLGNGAGAADEGLLIDDEVDFEDADIEMDGAASPEEEAGAADVSANAGEVAQFTEQAFDTILQDDQNATQNLTGQPSAPVADADQPASPKSEQPPTSARKHGDVEQQLAIANAELEKAKSRLSTLEKANSELDKATAKIRELERAAPDAARISELESQLSQVTFKCEQAEARAAELEAKLKSGPKSEDLHRVQRELEEARSKGGATARDFLELREQLNRKDKEMLDLRDQLTSRDKELLALRDTNLAQERVQADLNDKIAELEKQLSDLLRGNESLKADKEQAAKRAEDYKKRGEKLASDLEAAIQERRADKDKHDEELAMLKAQEAASSVEHQQTVASLRAEQEATLNAAVERARADTENTLREAHTSALAQKDAEVSQTREEKTAALAEARTKHEADLTTVREEADAIKEQAVAAREIELRQEHDSTLAALHRANEGLIAQQRNEHKAALEQLNTELAAMREHHSKLQTAWDENRVALGQAKESLQALLIQVAEISAKSVD